LYDDGRVSALDELVGQGLRRLPVAMRGKARAARALLGSRISRIRDLPVTAADGDRFLLPNIQEPVGWHLFIDGRYEPREVDWVLSQLRPGDTFVDCGANIGAFTIPVARRVGPSGRVLAIEASPRVLPYLRENVARNRLTNVTICPVAVDAEDGGTTTFYEADAGRFGGGSLLAGRGGQAASVPTRSLDALIAEHRIGGVRVLKIDVEGCEHRVLRGSSALLFGENAPAVLFEFIADGEGTPGEAQQIVRASGFEVWTLDDLTAGRVPLPNVLTTGTATLVARKQGGQTR
jgi:FkbM family methyltransferase